MHVFKMNLGEWLLDRDSIHALPFYLNILLWGEPGDSIAYSFGGAIQ
jgi:hypothetical protein